MPETDRQYRVLLVEDEQWVRLGLKNKIEGANLGFKVVAEAIDGASALQCLEREPVDLLVTDIRMPVMDGLELIRSTYFAWPGLPTLIVSGFNDFQYARQALKYGVVDYLLKPVAESDLLPTLTSVRIKLDAQYEASLREIPVPPAMSQDEMARTVELYIRENFRQDISLQEVSSRLRVSTDYLGKAFKKLTGESPLRHIIKLRIAEAKRLLLVDPPINIHSIGEMVGYSDPFYFSRIFKTYVGVYPSEFRGSRGQPATEAVPG